MVRDIEKIIETLQQVEKKQADSKVELINALQHLTETTKQLGQNTGQTVMALDGKINVIKDFIVKQAEELTTLKIRVANLEDELNAKD
jgi:hypothetical protein